MKTGEELYNERLTRIKTALDMGKPDRIPISMVGPGFIKYADPTAKMADYVNRPEYVDELMLKAYAMLPEIDAGPNMGPKMATMGAMWFAKTKLPGRELPEDALYQIDEIGAMTEDDYDTIIDKGWSYMKQELYDRLGYDPEKLKPDMGYLEKMQKKVREQGLVRIAGPAFMPPYEILSAARSISKFMMDLHRRPQKVIAAMDVMVDEIRAEIKRTVENTRPMTVFHGNSRCGCTFLSLKNFERFGWPYIKTMADAIIESGSKVFFHMDANWDDNLSYFKDFPKASCIFDPDSVTNIYKIKEVLGSTMCITGDVPPSLLSLGTPDEVYTYAKKLVDDFGPDGGFIMSSGCSVPPNASLENIKAVIAAVTG